MSRYDIQRYQASLTIDVSEDAGEIVSAAIQFNGLLRGVLVDAPDLDDTDTYTVAIKDADGYTIFSKASMAENTKTSVMVDANDMALAVPLSGAHTITITASGDQAADRAFGVALLIER